MRCERPTEVIEGSGHLGEPRAMEQVLSVRLTAPLLRDLRELAGRKGISVSDLVRATVTDLIEEQAPDPPCTAWHGVSPLPAS